MSYETILYEKREGVGIIRLNRPERMNAVIERMYLELGEALEGVEADEEVRALVITGSVRKSPKGDKAAFCAGADLKEHDTGRRSEEDKRAYIGLAHATTMKVQMLPKPVIAAVNGPARGAGAELALNADFLLMADTATLGFPETGLGTFVGGGVTWLLPRWIGAQRARELIYTGKILDGPEAQALGLALRSVPLASLMEEALKLAGVLALKAPISLKLAKHHLLAAATGELESALAAETKAITDCMKTEDWHEGVRAFAQRRAPEYKGR